MLPIVVTAGKGVVVFWSHVVAQLFIEYPAVTPHPFVASQLPHLPTDVMQNGFVNLKFGSVVILYEPGPTMKTLHVGFEPCAKTLPAVKQITRQNIDNKMNSLFIFNLLFRFGGYKQ